MRRINSLNAGLVSYWPLHEASGSRFDLTGAANTLTDINTVTQNPGRQIYAGQFTSANSERLNRANNALVQTGDIDFTYCAWVYLDSKPAFSPFVIKFSAVAGNYEYQLYYDGGADRAEFVVCRATDLAQVVTANNFGAFALATWHFVVGWHDATADTVNIAVNNSLPNSVATGGALQAAGTADMNLGGFSGGANFVNGRICEVGFWKRILSTRERLWLYNKGRGRSYPFDGRYSNAMLGRDRLGLAGGRRVRAIEE